MTTLCLPIVQVLGCISTPTQSPSLVVEQIVLSCQMAYTAQSLYEVDVSDLVDRILNHDTNSTNSIDELIDAIFDHEAKSPVNNVTAKWLDNRIRETGGMAGSFINHLKAAVGLKLPVSRIIGGIDDHIQSFFTKLISRDAFATRISEGHKVTDQQLAMFAVRSAYSDIRDSSTNPVCRELYGSRTDKERKDGSIIQPIKDPRVVFEYNDDGASTGTWSDIMDVTPNQEDLVGFKQVWDRLEGSIRDHKPNAADRYIDLLHYKSDGDSIGDIAEKEGVSVYRAASMMAEMRRVIRFEDLDELMGLSDE